MSSRHVCSFQNKHLLEFFVFLSNNCRKMRNLRTRNEIVNPCIIYFHFGNYTYLKVSEYPFKQNRNTSKNIKLLLYTHFYNIYLNVLRPTFFNICNLPFSYFPNIRKISVKVGPKTNYFSYFMTPTELQCSIFFFFHWYLAN